MDLKCPDSGACEHNRMENIAHLNTQDEVKFVLASRRDYEWARAQIAAHALDRKVKAVLLSAATGTVEPAAVVQWMLEDKLPARFQLQVHKYVWPANTRGV
jgi:7-carboxy-7-deazaguanine synthase